ncbi:ubiquitin-activating E1 FCCH domain-containing protein [Flavisphingomonas formosensis]|uniref:ubiquitin-activating E1 FCCH domain-containing protein n=1 Tax=Flavisphingomonas formosensis TaxID=861534 RepID=UPI0012F779EF|nr:ubiquitin-activating E1 FCCH domain-containing protein [Sphingomonas formosensis]
MSFRAGLYNFSKGVISPELMGRIDVAAYNSGLKQATNVVILKYGGVQMRMGTRLVMEIRESDLAKPVRLFPFEFSIEQTYVLEMGQGYMRPAALGGIVLEEELIVTGATQANPIVITAAFHGYAPGDDVFFKGIEGMTELNDRAFRVLAAIDDDTFSIDVDGTGFGAFTGSTGGITRTAAPEPPPPDPVVPPVVTPPPPVVVGGGSSFADILHRMFP